jgi:hypothetical protein
MTAENVCVICQEELNNSSNIVALPCMHVYHANCLKEHAMQKIRSNEKVDCPICRSVPFANDRFQYNMLINSLSVNSNKSKSNKSIDCINNNNNNNNNYYSNQRNHIGIDINLPDEIEINVVEQKNLDDNIKNITPFSIIKSEPSNGVPKPKVTSRMLIMISIVIIVVVISLSLTFTTFKM